VGKITETIKEYEQAVSALLGRVSKNPDEDAGTELVNALLIRDKIRAVTAETPISDGAAFAVLAEQDGRLKAAAKEIGKRIEPRFFTNCREAVPREDDQWWWASDKWFESGKPWWDVVLTGLTWISIALALSFSLEVVRAYLMGGADFTSTVLQGVVALITGTTIFSGARQLVTGGPPGIGKRFLSTHKSRLIIAGVIIAIAVTLVGTRKWAAGIYNDQGVEDFENRRLTRAIGKYQHAISLDPTLAQAHFNLGNVYEETQQYENAAKEYTSAILADQDFFHAYNNLARLFILDRKDNVGALKLIDKALNIIPKSDDAALKTVKYALLKNRAWANIELKNQEQARTDLAAALVERTDGITAHCLLARTLEADQNTEGALEQWKLCSDLADAQKTKLASGIAFDTDEPEPDWVETAKERLDKAANEPSTRKRK
jgi:tetratricopeptide (TPR) repeat protein